MFSPPRDRAVLCFRCNTFVCSALLTKFSVDYLSTDTPGEAHASAPWSGSIQAGAFEQFRQMLSRVEHACLHGVLGDADDLFDLDDRFLLIADEIDDIPMFWRQFRPAPAEDFTALLLPHCNFRVVGSGRATGPSRPWSANFCRTTASLAMTASSSSFVQEPTTSSES
jgi:hypothetical protein